MHTNEDILKHELYKARHIPYYSTQSWQCTPMIRNKMQNRTNGDIIINTIFYKHESKWSKFQLRCHSLDIYWTLFSEWNKCFRFPMGYCLSTVLTKKYLVCPKEKNSVVIKSHRKQIIFLYIMGMSHVPCLKANTAYTNLLHRMGNITNLLAIEH